MRVYIIYNIIHFHTIATVIINFRCTQCKETVIVKPHRDFWKSLQEHDHFESIYVDSLKNDYITLPSEQLDENSDREIINESISLVVQVCILILCKKTCSCFFFASEHFN